MTPRDLMQQARAASRMAAAAGTSGAMYGAYLLERRLHASHSIDDARLDRYIHGWTHTLLRLLNVQIRQVRLDTAAQGPRLVVSNHRSAIDILLMLDLFGGHILARGDMAHWPAIGTLARVAGTLFVDREGDSSSRAVAIRRIRERLLAGRTVIVFPEGTTFPGDEVRPFHAGAFMAVARTGPAVPVPVHILPVGIAYQDEAAFFGDEPFTAHMRRLAAASRTAVSVAVGQGIPAEGKSARELCELAHVHVQDLVNRARLSFAV